MLSKQRTIKALIRLRGCAGWYAPLLFAYDIRHIFSCPGSIVFWYNDVLFEDDSFISEYDFEVYLIVGTFLHHSYYSWTIACTKTGVGSIYKSIIFWPPPPPAPTIKIQRWLHYIRIQFWSLLDHWNTFTSFILFLNDCLLKIRGGSIHYGIIFWPPPAPLPLPPPPPPPAPTKYFYIIHILLKRLLAQRQWVGQYIIVLYFDSPRFPLAPPPRTHNQNSKSSCLC